MRIPTVPARLVPALLGAALLACGSDNEPPPPPPRTVATVRVTPTLDTVTTLGGTRQFQATALDGQGGLIEGTTFTWTSSASAIATVAESGLVTAVTEGSATITAYADEIAGYAPVVVWIPPTSATIEGVINTTPRSADEPTSSVRAVARANQKAVRMPKRAPARGDLIVTFRGAAIGVPGGPAARASGAVQQHAAREMRTVLARSVAGQAQVRGVSPALLAARVVVVPGVPVAAVIARLEANPAVATVEPNFIMQRDALPVPASRAAPLLVPNDPSYVSQAWHYSMIDLPRAWPLATGNASVLVAVVDDGIRFDHPEILANLTRDGYDFVMPDSAEDLCSGSLLRNEGDGDGPDPDPTAPFSYDFLYYDGCPVASEAGNHGLHVAGTIGAVGNDGAGVTGVNWNVRIRPVRVLGTLGYGTYYDVAQGILYAAGLPADDGAGGTVTAPSRAPIINMSLGGSEPSTVMEAAVQAATAAGSLVIVSAGNSGWTDAQFPAAYDEVVSVSAVGPDRRLAWYSSYGPTVDIAAPGGAADGVNSTLGVYSLAWNFATGQPTHAYWNGTSMAAPHVAGVAALVLGANPGLSASQLRARLERHARDLGAAGNDDNFGHGLVSAYRSLTEQSEASMRSTRVFLFDASGRVVATNDATASRRFSFTNLADGVYRVFAGEDEDGDALFGQPLRRWGAFGHVAKPTEITVNGPGRATANVSLVTPNEMESNDQPTKANELQIGGWVLGSIGIAGTDADFYRVAVPAAGTYTFESGAMRGACGFALEEKTVLELQTEGGGLVAQSNSAVDATFVTCARITQTLEAGVYLIKVSASPDVPNGTMGRRYVLAAR